MLPRMSRRADSVWSSLRGHEEPLRQLREALSRGRFSQSYLFVGPAGIGKRRFATLLAQCLFCRAIPDEELEACGECSGCRPFLAGSHPDFLLVERESGKRELTIDKFIGDKEERGRAGLCHDLSLRPSVGNRKIAVIDDADTMNDESANALLKTLEEPPPGAVLILIAASADKLLPTIRSRCQEVRFSPLSDSDLAGLLLDQNLVESDDEARRVAAVSGGSLVMAAQLIDPQMRELRQILRNWLRSSTAGGIDLAKKIVELADQVQTPGLDQRAVARWSVRFLVEAINDWVRLDCRPQDIGDPTFADVAAWTQSSTVQGPDRIDLATDCIDPLLALDASLEQNVPVPLALEAGLCEVARLWQRR